MTYKQIFLILLFAFPIFCITGQEKPAWSVGLNTHYGAVFNYNSMQPDIMYPHLYGFELYGTKITNGSRRWEKIYNYPDIGLALSYYNFNDLKEMGESYQITTYLDFFFNNNKRGKFRFNMGTGLVYTTKRFNAETNPGNNAVSTKISYVLRGTIHYEFYLSENYRFNINASYRHYSNGKMDVPNAGINFPLVGMGVRYLIKPKEIDRPKDTNRDFDKKLHLNIMTSTSWRQVWEEDIRHKAYSFSLYASKGVSKFNAVLLGIDGFYYEDINIEREVGKGFIEEEIVIDGRQLGLTFGTEFYLGNLWVIAQQGFYVYMPAKIYPSTYQRFGLKYLVHKDVFIQASLKTHSSVADMVEFGIGFKI